MNSLQQVPELLKFEESHKPLQFLEIGGQILFPSYTASGGLMSKCIAVLLDEKGQESTDRTEIGLPDAGEDFSVRQFLNGGKYAVMWMHDSNAEMLERAAKELLQ